MSVRPNNALQLTSGPATMDAARSLTQCCMDTSRTMAVVASRGVGAEASQPDHGHHDHRRGHKGPGLPEAAQVVRARSLAQAKGQVAGGTAQRQAGTRRSCTGMRRTASVG